MTEPTPRTFTQVAIEHAKEVDRLQAALARRDALLLSLKQDLQAVDSERAKVMIQRIERELGSKT